ncbi:MAG: hypothetical protein D6782_00575, partial [Alphaproteobacteria bacterium]
MGLAAAAQRYCGANKTNGANNTNGDSKRGEGIMTINHLSFRGLLMAGAALSAAGAGTGAWAQSGATALEEIIVTAEKREQ